ncbi:hypothetical protein ACLSZY_10895, partial [Avibacterium volantium]|uniref:hypothetical protein n=1 Tax=Avibacterium TaxID=292486 RepID=UPI0039FD5742
MDKNETVAYQSWVNAQKVNKSGDTMTGKLIVPMLEVTSNNNGANNIKIGDDAFIGDDAIVHTVKIKSATETTKGFVAFGNASYCLGKDINYNSEPNILEWEGNYISLKAIDDGCAGIDFFRSGNQGDFRMRLEALPDRRWKFWNEGSHEIFLPARAGTVALAGDVAVLTGVINHNQTLPLPAGFSESQCRWLVSMRDDNENGAEWDVNEGETVVHKRNFCYTNGRTVIAYTRIFNDRGNIYQDLPGNVNYI